jgi:hypothetical protein
LEALRESEDEIDKRSKAYYALLYNQLCASIDTDDLLVQLCRLWQARLLHDGDVRTKSDRFINEVSPPLLTVTSIAIEAAEKIGFGSFAKLQSTALQNTKVKARSTRVQNESPRAAHSRIKRRIQSLICETVNRQNSCEQSSVAASF